MYIGSSTTLSVVALSLSFWVCQSAFAALYTVIELETEEAVFNEPSDTLAPTTLNNVVGFTVERGNGPSSRISTESYYGLRPASVDTPFPIQPKTLDGQNLSTKLFAYDADYLSAGRQGLSLSTGINKTTSQQRESWFFPVIFLDPSAVDDDIVDFLVADIADNQSPDLWEFLDSNGDPIASITTEGPQTGGTDWNRIGTLNLNRWSNAAGQVEAFNNRELSAMALELSDFTGLTSANASLVASMRVTIADPSLSSQRPRTDYAFISSDINSIRFSNQLGPANIPSPSTVALLLLGLLFVATTQYRKRAVWPAKRK